MSHRTDPEPPTPSPKLYRFVWITVGVVVALAVLVTATIGLLVGPPTQSDTPLVGQRSAPPASDDSPNVVELEPRLPEVIETTDATRFARSTAEALFEWNTADGLLPRDYAQVIIDVGHVGSNELNGLVHDVETYLPTQAAWVELQKYETAQSLRIDRIEVPDRWQDVLDQARDDTILPGTVAYTVDGVRERTGVWEGEQVRTEHPVSFTLFIICSLDEKPCRLLRLSGLDTPLR